jgi:hypothetical protein
MVSDTVSEKEKLWTLMITSFKNKCENIIGTHSVFLVYLSSSVAIIYLANIISFVFFFLF